MYDFELPEIDSRFKAIMAMIGKEVPKGLVYLVDDKFSKMSVINYFQSPVE
jgi:hypothetical protein